MLVAPASYEFLPANESDIRGIVLMMDSDIVHLLSRVIDFINTSQRG
jgi:hypothetical protein